VVGCSKSTNDEANEVTNDMQTLEKWLVDVQCEGCRGLFYRSSPSVIVPDADWPRNGDIVVGYELATTPGRSYSLVCIWAVPGGCLTVLCSTIGWIRLQNGYYLPIYSDDKQIRFLHKVSSRAQPSNTEMKRIGSSTPLFRASSVEKDKITSLLDGALQLGSVATAVAEPPVKPDIASIPEPDGNKETVRAAIHMDAMAFGMGCCCLQITFQAKDVEESRFIYDQLAVLAPIMMALTASTPLLRGRIADTDCRWGIISESVDDRTLAERGRDDPSAPYQDLNEGGNRRIYKSRYDSISTYIYQGALYLEDEYNNAKKSGLENRVLNIYNDIPVPIDEASYQQLREAGIDPALAQHVAHLFIRDPLVVFSGAVEEVDDETQTEHFESIQSTNWYVVARQGSVLCSGVANACFLLAGNLYDGSPRLLETAPTTPTLVGARNSAAWRFNSPISRTLLLQFSLCS
jgi:Glutamate-cysteine ligase